MALPRGVIDETARSRVGQGAERVPDLHQHPAIEACDIDDAALASVGAVFVGQARQTTEYRLDVHRIDRPELEVVLLARQRGGFAVVEDKAALRIAGKLAVPVVGTAELLCDLEVRGLLPDAVAAAQVIRATKYLTKDLILLASGTRRRQWRVPLTLPRGYPANS